MNYNRFIAILALLIIAVSVQAQSGRRQTKPAPAAPVPTPTPEATPTPTKDQKEPELRILVASDRNSGPVSVPFTFYDAAQRGCADQLGKKSSAGIDIAQSDMTRGEAIKKAKSEAKTYVVLLTLVFDTMSNRYDDLQLDFVVFEPVTAKVVITGRSYLNTNRQGPLVVGPTSRGPGGMYREQWLRQAGEEAANRILKALHLGRFTHTKVISN